MGWVSPHLFFGVGLSLAGKQALAAQNGLYEFTLVVGIEDLIGQVDDLYFGEVQGDVVAAYLGALHFVPAQGHALARVELDQDLLAVDLVAQFLEKELVLFELGQAVELNEPEGGVEYKGNEGADEAEDEGDEARSHADPADHGEVDIRDGVTDGEREDRADDQQEDAQTGSHWFSNR